MKFTVQSSKFKVERLVQQEFMVCSPASSASVVSPGSVVWLRLGRPEDSAPYPIRSGSGCPDGSGADERSTQATASSSVSQVRSGDTT